MAVNPSNVLPSNINATVSIEGAAAIFRSYRVNPETKRAAIDREYVCTVHRITTEIPELWAHRRRRTFVNEIVTLMWDDSHTLLSDPEAQIAARVMFKSIEEVEDFIRNGDTACAIQRDAWITHRAVTHTTNA